MTEFDFYQVRRSNPKHKYSFPSMCPLNLYQVRRSNPKRKYSFPSICPLNLEIKMHTFNVSLMFCLMIFLIDKQSTELAFNGLK